MQDTANDAPEDVADDFEADDDAAESVEETGGTDVAEADGGPPD